MGLRAPRKSVEPRRLASSATYPRAAGSVFPVPTAATRSSWSEQALHGFHLDGSENHHDVEVALAALVVSARAGAAGRGPSRSDVDAVADQFGFRRPATPDEVASLPTEVCGRWAQLLSPARLRRLSRERS
jgi:hypothetical protein